MKVKDCMSHNVSWVKPENTIKDCATIMCNNHVGCVPVCDNAQNVVGLVTDRDIILRCIACDKDVKTTPVSEIMTCDVCTCKKDEEMSNVESKMSQNQIRRIPVCDCNNHVVGILTLGDLAQNDKELGKQEVCTTISNICNCGTQTKNDQ